MRSECQASGLGASDARLAANIGHISHRQLAFLFQRHSLGQSSLIIHDEGSEELCERRFVNGHVSILQGGRGMSRVQLHLFDFVDVGFSHVFLSVYHSKVARVSATLFTERKDGFSSTSTGTRENIVRSPLGRAASSLAMRASASSLLLQSETGEGLVKGVRLETSQRESVLLLICSHCSERGG